MSTDLSAAMISSGILPLELEHYLINTIEDNEKRSIGFRTVVRINSPELGVLYPEQYRVVSNRTAQCIKLSTWAFNKLIDDADKFIDKYPEDFFVSVYFPTRMLLKSDLEKLLDAVPEEKRYIIPRLVFEFSSDILLMISPELSKKLSDFKENYGIKLMISEFGDEFCPILRLNGLPFDYVVLDKSLSVPNVLSSVSTRSVIQIIKSNSMVCILENSGKRGLTEAAAGCGCSYYCSNRKTNPAGVR